MFRSEGKGVAQLKFEPRAIDADRRRRLAVPVRARTADGELGCLVLLVRLAAVVPTLAVPTFTTRVAARIGGGRCPAGDPDLWLEEICRVQHGSSATDEQRRVQAKAVVEARRTDDARGPWVVHPHRLASLALRGVHDVERRKGAWLAHDLVAGNVVSRSKASCDGAPHRDPVRA